MGKPHDTGDITAEFLKASGKTGVDKYLPHSGAHCARKYGMVESGPGIRKERYL